MSSCDRSAFSRRRFVRLLPLMKRRRFGWRVTRVVMRPVSVFEASYRQIIGGFLDTEGFCRVFIPRLRGFLSYSYIKSKNYFGRVFGFSLFAFSGEFSSVPFFFLFSVVFCEFVSVNLEFLSLSFRSFLVGVSRFAENSLGPPPIEGFVSSDSVLHRLLAELYSVRYPSSSTWESIRGRMAANEVEWSLPLSEELPEELSDESAEGVTREGSSEAVPSTSGSRQSTGVDRSWKALSYFSRLTQDDIDRIRRRYQILDEVVLRIPNSDERACCPKYEGDVAFYEADLRAGLRFPV